MEDLTGKKFGRLTVIEFINRIVKGKSYTYYWLCRCDCGKYKKVEGGHLRSGRTKSCGCLTRENTIKRNFKHGLTNTRIFRIWQGIFTRCYNKKFDNYKYYGGRGITVCEEWKNDFMTFYNWAMDNGYADNLTIDRIDVNGNYEPNNCRWITNAEQQRNRRNTVYITYNNETHNFYEWSKITGININTLHTRYSRNKELFKND